MRIEQSAYANRWRQVSPAAKGILALGGFIAAFVAGTPQSAVLIAGLLLAVALLGARIAPGTYLRVALPPLLFLALGSLSLIFSLQLGEGAETLVWHQTGLQHAAQTGARSLGALAALLLLVLSTPMTDLIALMRRLKCPEVLLDIMVLSYRMLFVFSAAVHDTSTAQSARLGYATPRLALHSLGQLVANLTLQVWHRAQALHLAAQARNNDGPLRFLEPGFDHAKRDLALASLAGLGLILLAAVAP